MAVKKKKVPDPMQGFYSDTLGYAKDAFKELGSFLTIPGEEEKKARPVVQSEAPTVQQMKQEEPPEPKASLTSPEVFRDQYGKITGVMLPNGKVFQGQEEDILKIIEMNRATPLPAGTAPVGAAQARLNQQMESEQLAGQVGQIGQTSLSNASLFDYEQGIKQGIIQAIPSGIQMAVYGAGLGLVGAKAGATIGTAITPGVGTIIGGVAGFAAGLGRSIISEAGAQRRDTISSQKSVLEEGKQAQRDLINLAKAYPARKEYYLAQYNKVGADILAAYRQMKYDVQRDAAKFEKAVPDLAEFEIFFAPGQERDNLNEEMKLALMTPSNPEYDLLELAWRKGMIQ